MRYMLRTSIIHNKFMNVFEIKEGEALAPGRNEDFVLHEAFPGDRNENIMGVRTSDTRLVGISEQENSARWARASSRSSNRGFRIGHGILSAIAAGLVWAAVNLPSLAAPAGIISLGGFLPIWIVSLALAGLATGIFYVVLKHSNII